MATIKLQMKRLNKVMPSAFKHELEIECEMTEQQMSDLALRFFMTLTEDERDEWLERQGFKVCA